MEKIQGGMKLKNSKLYFFAANLLMIWSAVLFFWKLLLSPEASKELISATASILCMIASGILFTVYFAAKNDEANKKD